MTDDQLKIIINQSFVLAKAAHRDQKRRNGEDYFENHVVLVANMVEDRLKPIALLHDTVEDTQITLQDLIEAGFPKYVTDAVDLLTHKSDEPNVQYWRKIAKNRDAAIVKIADMKNNLSSNPTERQKLKYAVGLKLFADAGYDIF